MKKFPFREGGSRKQWLNAGFAEDTNSKSSPATYWLWIWGRRHTFLHYKVEKIIAFRKAHKTTDSMNEYMIWSCLSKNLSPSSTIHNTKVEATQSAVERIKREWYIHTTEYQSVLKRKRILKHTTTWINLENIMLHEISRIGKLRETESRFEVEVTRDWGEGMIGSYYSVVTEFLFGVIESGDRYTTL